MTARRAARITRNARHVRRFLEYTRADGGRRQAWALSLSREFAEHAQCVVRDRSVPHGFRWQHLADLGD